MSKRRISLPPLPPAKRLHSDAEKNDTDTVALPRSLQTMLYDELLLSIFSYLSWMDLCNVQATNRNWHRLATDNELWRKLYLRVFGRARLRGVRGFIGRPDGREVKPLPERSRTGTSGGDKDWKCMFRISSNWRRGRCVAEHPNIGADAEGPHRTYILIAGAITISATGAPSDCPLVCLTGLHGLRQVLPCRSTCSGNSLSITALAVDQSPPSSTTFRLVAFLSSGEFSMFTVKVAGSSVEWSTLTYAPTRRSSRTSPILHAVYHHPVLITLSQSFSLSIYDISNTINHTQTLSSFTSFPPASLVLSVSAPSTYKLILAYSVPVYPAHWSVGVTEAIIAGQPNGSQIIGSGPAASSSFENFAGSPRDPFRVITTRTVRGVDVPPGWIDIVKLRAMREQWNRKVFQVADVQTDGKWLVLAAGDATPATVQPRSEPTPPPSPWAILQLYRLSFSSPSASVASPPPKLTFVRNLHGQMGPVSTLCVADGRCVSYGANGSIWVWDLEGDAGVEVARPDTTPGSPIENPGTVAFDERRILTVGKAGVVVRRFDI